MSAAESKMMPLGTPAKEFKLLDVKTGENVSLSELRSDIATVIMFICNHCPYVKHIQKGLVELANDYTPKGISFIAVSSNDIEKYPDDSPRMMRLEAERLKYPFPYLYDESQNAARDYMAACTPDFYIFDKNMLCVYRGQFDDSRPGNKIPVTGGDIRNALDDIIAHIPVNLIQKPSIGCSIKWK